MIKHTKQPPLAQVLAHLPEDDPSFGQVVAMSTYHRNEVIASPNNLRGKLHILMDGRAQLVSTNAEGRRLVLATLEAGSIFGEGALLDGVAADALAEALTDCTVWVLPRSQARVMTERYPILGWGLLQTFGKRLMQVESRLEDVAYKKLPERLAALLLELAGNEETTITGTSHQALADRLGTYRETVSAILRTFKREGWVDLGYRRIRILDVPALETAANSF